MSEIKSEVLFNRSLLWLLLAGVTDNRNLRILYIVCACWNLFRSIGVVTNG